MISVAVLPPERELAEIVTDPVAFARGVLGHDVWATPAAIMRAMAEPRARVAVKACHASGKTFTAAEIVVWALTAYERVKIVTTAPTWHQVEALLWGEIHKAAATSRIAYPSLPNKTDWTLKTGTRYAEGLSTTEAVRFQGYHADEGGVVIIVMDEAPGVRTEIWDAIDGIRAGGDVRVLAMGNPVVGSGPFFDAFTTNREGWTLFSIDAFETPNLEGVTLERLLEMSDAELDHNPRPYLVTRRWVRERYDEWGTGHPMWEARVRAQFPSQAEDALFALSWIEAAANREAVDGGGDIIGGLDVAGPGEDETSLWLRAGPSIIKSWHSTKADPRGDIMAQLAPYRDRLRALAVDADGIGWGMYLHLRDMGYPVVEFHAGGQARDKERFRNLKAEAYWTFRERLQAGEVNGLQDARTQAQLATVRYRHTPRGQVEIETKEEMRKRGVRSPDRAEGLILAFAVDRPQQPKVRRGTPLHRWRELRA
jgi:hypothetical protein